MGITLKEAHCLNRDSIPEEGETISDDGIDVDSLIKQTTYIEYYFRKPEECPFGRGNWIVDMHFKAGGILCFKYPKEMTEDRLLCFLKPLIDKAQELMK